jgi:type IV pilus assembly protein PilW
MATRAHKRFPREHGAGLVETMVGILIGLLVVLVIYNMLAVTESYKRMSVGMSDAQITGMLSQFMVGREASNGGNGISISAPDLMTCDPAKANAAWPYNQVGPLPALWRPIPAMVQDGGANLSDSLITMYSGASRVIWPVTFTSDAAPGQPFTVQSPNGFSAPSPAATPYLTIAINPSTGDCEATMVTAATAPDPFGRVTLTHSATAQSYLASVDPGAKLLILGPQGLATRTLYENWDPVAGGPCGTNLVNRGPCQIYSTDLLTAGASRVPLAQNVVLVKIQYGLDMKPTLTGAVDCWAPAVADISGLTGSSPTGCNPGGAAPKNFTPGALRTANQLDLQRIVALRIGVVVRSDEPATQQEKTSPTYNLVAALRPQTYLFNCAANTNAGCPQRIRVDTVFEDDWRYRTYETVVPLRNAIFNSLP